MQFQPKSEKEIAESKLLPAGEYDFEVTYGMDKTSKAGNDMIELKLMVFKPDGKFIMVSDYLMESMMYKLSHAAKACGLETEYNAGELTGEMFSGKTGRLKLNIQSDKTGQYPDRNGVQDYVVSADGKPAVEQVVKSVDDTLDDAIPWA